jgi:hypothetical protein
VPDSPPPLLDCMRALRYEGRSSPSKRGLGMALVDTTGLHHVRGLRPVACTGDAMQDNAITYGEVMDLTGFGIAILSFSDPDGVHLELTAPL